MFIDLIRHGESTGNARRLIFGITDCPLTERGRYQAQARAERCAGLGHIRVVASPLQRARETAEIIAGVTHTSVETDERLIEQDMGRWENHTGDYVVAHDRALFDAMMADWTHTSPPGGESFDSVMNRAGEAIGEIISRGEDALVVCHAGTIAAAMVALGLWPREKVLDLHIPFAGGLRLNMTPYQKPSP